MESLQERTGRRDTTKQTTKRTTYSLNERPTSYTDGFILHRYFRITETKTYIVQSLPYRHVRVTSMLGTGSVFDRVQSSGASLAHLHSQSLIRKLLLGPEEVDGGGEGIFWATPSLYGMSPARRDEDGIRGIDQE